MSHCQFLVCSPVKFLHALNVACFHVFILLEIKIKVTHSDTHFHLLFCPLLLIPLAGDSCAHLTININLDLTIIDSLLLSHLNGVSTLTEHNNVETTSQKQPQT